VPPRVPRRTRRPGSQERRAGRWGNPREKPTPISSRTSICSCGRSPRGQRRAREQRVRNSGSETCESPFVRAEVVCPEPRGRVRCRCPFCDTTSIDTCLSAVCEVAHQEEKSNWRCLTDGKENGEGKGGKKRGHSTFPTLHRRVPRRRTTIRPLLVSSDGHLVVGSTLNPIPWRSLSSTALCRTVGRVGCSPYVASPRHLSAGRSCASAIPLGVGSATRPPSACNILESSLGSTNANPRLARLSSHAVDCVRCTAAPRVSGRLLESEMP